MLAKFINYFILGLAVFLGTLSLLPPLAMFGMKQAIDIDFVAYHPQPFDNADFVPNQILDTIDYINLGKHEGPESIAINSKGDIYFSLKTGEIRYILRDDVIIDRYKESPSHPYAVVGRPLGIYFDSHDNLLVADSVKGLLRIDKTRDTIEILTASFNGTKKLTFVNDVTTSDDGMIYFSDSTSLAPILDKDGDWNTYIPSIFTAFSGTTPGKLLSFNPKTKETKVLVEKIAYANGVTMDSNQESVFVCESSTTRVLRYWIKGVNAGKSQIYIDNLPGFPDNIRLGSDGKLYIAIFGARSRLFSFIHPYPMLKRLAVRLPFLIPSGHGVPLIVVADQKNGNIIESYQGHNSPLKTITSALELNGKVYIGGLFGNLIGVYKK